jgi:hypothetical protein
MVNTLPFSGSFILADSFSSSFRCRRGSRGRGRIASKDRTNEVTKICNVKNCTTAANQPPPFRPLHRFFPFHLRHSAHTYTLVVRVLVPSSSSRSSYKAPYGYNASTHYHLIEHRLRRYASHGPLRLQRSRCVASHRSFYTPPRKERKAPTAIVGLRVSLIIQTCSSSRSECTSPLRPGLHLNHWRRTWRHTTLTLISS